MTENRRKPRKGCKVRATIRAGANECRAYVVDLNEFGVRLLVENTVRSISEGDEIEIHTEELGLLKGRARWRSSHRIGIEFSESAETLGQLATCWESAKSRRPKLAPVLPPAQSSSNEIMSDDRKIADDLARVAARPEMFTKADMAHLMKRAAQKIRRDEGVLASMKEVLSEVTFVVRREDRAASAGHPGTGH